MSDNFSDRQAFEAHQNFRVVLLCMLFICILVLGAILVASVLTVDETAVAPGEVVPQKQVKIVQHLEGGLIESVVAKNGMRVAKNQLILSFDPVVTLTELERTQNQQLMLRLTVARLNAYINNDMNAFESDVLELKNTQLSSAIVFDSDEFANSVAEQKELLATGLRADDEQRDRLRFKISQKMTQIEQLREEEKILINHNALLEQEQAIYDQLQQADAMDSATYLKMKRSLNQAQGNLLSIHSRVLQANQVLEELKNRLSVLIDTQYEEALITLTEADFDLLNIESTMNQLTDRLSRLTVEAPIEGIVNALDVMPGNVVLPGSVLFEIVPLDGGMHVEARISTKDIGLVHVGDKVNVRVLTYDYTQYGFIVGELMGLSASTYIDHDGVPYYQAQVSLTQNYLGDVQDENLILPGMTVVADVIVDSKSLLNYVLKPVQQTWDVS